MSAYITFLLVVAIRYERSSAIHEIAEGDEDGDETAATDERYVRFVLCFGACESDRQAAKHGATTGLLRCEA